MKYNHEDVRPAVSVKVIYVYFILLLSFKLYIGIKIIIQKKRPLTTWKEPINPKHIIDENFKTESLLLLIKLNPASIQTNGTKKVFIIPLKNVYHWIKEKIRNEKMMIGQLQFIIFISFCVFVYSLRKRENNTIARATLI